MDISQDKYQGYHLLPLNCANHTLLCFPSGLLLSLFLSSVIAGHAILDARCAVTSCADHGLVHAAKHTSTPLVTTTRGRKLSN